MDTHYVCTGGCGAVSAVPGTCGDESCPMYNMDFTECDCEDGGHDKAVKAKSAGSADPWDDLDNEKVEVDPDEVGQWQSKFGKEEDYN